VLYDIANQVRWVEVKVMVRIQIVHIIHGMHINISLYGYQLSSCDGFSYYYRFSDI